MMRPPLPPSALQQRVAIADQLDEMSRLAAESCKPNAPKLTLTATDRGVVMGPIDEPKTSQADMERDVARVRVREDRVVRSVCEVTGCSRADAWDRIARLPPGVFELLLRQDKYQRRDTIAHHIGILGEIDHG